MIEILISSVIKGYEDIRKKLKENLINTNLFEVKLSEHEVSQSISSLKLCEELAKNCGIFLLILGKRYGTKIEGGNISVTEFEFNVALKNDSNKILVFIEKLDKDKIEVDQRAFIQKVTDLRKGFFVNFFESGNIEELIVKVNKSISAHVSRFLKNKKDLIKSNPFESFDIERINNFIDFEENPHCIVKIAPINYLSLNIDNIKKIVEEILDTPKIKDPFYPFLFKEMKLYDDFIRFYIRNNGDYLKILTTIIDNNTRLIHLNSIKPIDKEKQIIYTGSLCRRLTIYFIFIKNFYQEISNLLDQNIDYLYFSYELKNIKGLYLDLPEHWYGVRYDWYYKTIHPRDLIISDDNYILKDFYFELEDNFKEILSKIFKKILRGIGFDYTEFEEEHAVNFILEKELEDNINKYNLNDDLVLM